MKIGIVWGKRRGVYGVWWGKLKEIDQLEHPDVDRRLILRWIFSKWNVGMDWIDLAQDRDI